MTKYTKALTSYLSSPEEKTVLPKKSPNLTPSLGQVLNCTMTDNTKGVGNEQCLRVVRTY